MIEIALAVSLWVNACFIDGSLHGKPQAICRELQIQPYPDMQTCAREHTKAAEEWVKGMRVYNLDLYLKGSRCDAAKAEADGDYI